MRVLVVGATGALGRPLVRHLVKAGHHVLAASRRPAVGTVGSSLTPVTLDVLRPDAVAAAVREHEPEVVVHFATAIPRAINPRRIGAQFRQTNRLRTEGTRLLLEAAGTVGVQRFLAQGLAYAYEPGDAVRDEDCPLWELPPRTFAPVVRALREMEALVTDHGGTVLRLGHLYGPGTIYAPDGSMTHAVRRGKVPIVGEGDALFSFVHVEDVARAVAAALNHDGGGAFNIVDDQPLRIREWLPWFATQVGGRPPRRIPVSMARLAVGRYGAAFMNELSGASNHRARSTFGWEPVHPGFLVRTATDVA